MQMTKPIPIDYMFLSICLSGYLSFYLSFFYIYIYTTVDFIPFSRSVQRQIYIILCSEVGEHLIRLRIGRKAISCFIGKLYYIIFVFSC